MPTRAGRAHRLRIGTAGLLLAGCAAAGSAAGAGGSSVGPVAATAATPAGEEGRMIGFSVEGGFANQIRALRLDPDGTALVDVSGRSAGGRLDAARVAAITAELDASRLFDRDRTYPAPAGADQQRFEITYDGVTVVAYDGTVPPELAEAVRLLEESLRDAQR